jgi:DNA-binding LacI/PurR family transcriptional regulator
LTLTLKRSGLPLVLVDLLTHLNEPESIRIDYEAGARAAISITWWPELRLALCAC